MKSKLRGVKHRIQEPTPSCSDNSFTGLPLQMSADQRADAEQQAKSAGSVSGHLGHHRGVHHSLCRKKAGLKDV